MADPPTATQVDLSGIWVGVESDYFREKGAPLAAYLDQGARGFVLELSATPDPSEAISAYTSLMGMVPRETGIGLRLPGDLRLEPAILEQAGLVAASFVVVEPPWETPSADIGKPLLVGFSTRNFSNVQAIADYYAQIEAAGVYWTQGEVLDLQSRVDDFGSVPLSILIAPRTTGREESPWFFVNSMKDVAVSTGLPIKGVVLGANWPHLLEEMPKLAALFPAAGAEPAQQQAPDEAEVESAASKILEVEDQGENRETASVAVSDAYTTKDTLGYSVYADALADFSAHPETLPPLAIGITAAWGMGKTSLMRQIEERFKQVRERRSQEGEPAEGDPDVRVPFRTVWVDVWRYENSASLWASLAEEVYQQTARQMAWWERQKFRMALDTDWGDNWPKDSVLGMKNILQRRAKKAIGLGFFSFIIPLVAILATGLDDWLAEQLSGVAAFVGLTGAIAATVTAVTLTGLGALRDTLTREIKRFASPPDNSEQVAYSKKSEDQIHRLVKILSRPEEGIRLAVFVDDLDRCSPDRVVDVVESINLLFSQSEGAGAVFFVGLDVDMVAASIDVAFEDTVKELRARGNQAGNDFGYRFLQKILQMTFMIPPPLPHRVQTFLDSLLGAEAGGAEPEVPPHFASNNITPADRIEAESAVQAVRVQGTIGGVQSVAQRAEVNLSPGASEVMREEVAQVTLSLLRTDSPDVQKAVRSAVAFLEPRPRNYKRFLNAFRLHVIIASRAEHRPGAEPASLAHLAKWTALQLRWPVILEEARTQDDLFHELEPLARDYAGAKARLDHLTNAGAEHGDEAAMDENITAETERMNRALEAFPRRIRASGEFEELIKVLAAEPSLAGADLHGLVLV
jgi:hypothetical protein